MKQIWITRKGGPEVLQLRETADPVPGSDQVLIKVRAAGVNFSDILARRGRYPEAPNPPVVGGYEVSGIIEAVGEGVLDSITTYLNSYSIAGLAGIENLRFDGTGSFVGTGNAGNNSLLAVRRG